MLPASIFKWIWFLYIARRHIWSFMSPTWSSGATHWKSPKDWHQKFTSYRYIHPSWIYVTRWFGAFINSFFTCFFSQSKIILWLKFSVIFKNKNSVCKFEYIWFCVDWRNSLINSYIHLHVLISGTESPRKCFDSTRPKHFTFFLLIMADCSW